MTQAGFEQIPRRKIHWPSQERKHFGKEELLELAATITAHGVIEPIGVVRDGDGYLGLWGQRRWIASELAGLDLIPAIVRETPGNEAEAMELRLVENISREQLRPIEQAVGLDQLMKASGLGVSEVAKRVGLKSAAVTKSLALLQLPDPLRQQVEQGTISPAAGYELARISDARLQAHFAAQVAAGTLNRDSLVGKIKASKGKRSQSGPGKQGGVTARLGGGRQVTVRAEQLSVESFIATLEDLLARCRAARTKGLSLRTMLSVLADEARRSGVCASDGE